VGENAGSEEQEVGLLGNAVAATSKGCLHSGNSSCHPVASVISLGLMSGVESSVFVEGKQGSLPSVSSGRTEKLNARGGVRTTTPWQCGFYEAVLLQFSVYV